MDSAKIAAQQNFTQNITFDGSEKEFSYEIVAQEVTVHSSPGVHHHGSSKVKLTDVVDYNWELRFYVGQLLAVHLNGRIIAYGIKGKSGGMVRVSNVETNRRALIKEMNGLVQDISFAQIPQQIVLACVDAEGSLFVYNIEDKSDSLACKLLMHVVHSNFEITNYRVIWCPYLPSYGEDADTLDDPAKLLALLNGDKVEVWDVSIINSHFGIDPLQPTVGYEGYAEINAHSLDVVDASFSPDGTAIATASLDGLVKFFQVYMIENEEPRCLHEWKPHDGAALSSLLFLDNMHAYGPESRFWKFAITGSNYNSELKIWSCESWSCLQTVHFTSHPNSITPQLFFKVRLDMSGHYLLMSDVNNRILYVLQIEKNDSERVATISSISEFLLPAPILSYYITNANITKCHYTGSSDDLSIETSDEEKDMTAVVIKMYVVQPKKLQKCTITFQPESLLSLNCENDTLAESSEQTLVNINDKTDDEQESEIENSELPQLNNLQSSVNYLIQQQTAQPTLTLMTPDAFNTTSSTHTSPNNKRNSITPPVLSKFEKSTEDVKIESLIDTENIEYEEPQKENFTSAHSSPSREVEEILALTSKDELIEIFKKIDNDLDAKYKTQTDSVIYKENSNETGWPNIPIPNENEIVKEESRKLANLDNDVIEKISVSQVNMRLNTLETVLHEQNNQLQKLQTEIRTLSKDFKDDLMDNMKGLFCIELEKALSRSQIQQTKTLDNYVNIQKNIEDERNESIVSITAPLLMKQITEKLQYTINHEIKNVVLPAIINIFESLKHQLTVEYSQKLNTTDQLLKENISKLITSKPVSETLSLSILSIIKPPLEDCYKEMVKTTLIPSWERVCGRMFQQIHDTFTKGTKEYAASVETYIDRQRRVQDKGKDLVVQMQNISDTIKSNADKLTNGMSHDIEHQLNSSFSSMQEQLTRSVGNALTETLRQGFKNHAAIFEDSIMNAVRSRAVTPAPHVKDTQVQLAHIQQLLLKGQIDAAFQQALSASDLSLVVHVCEKLSPQEVFASDHCKLPQPVLLSLIQQLSADLGRNTELKQKYLKEAILNLEPSNAVTREHMPVVLSELLHQLTNFLSAHPTDKNAKDLRLLRMAIQSLLRD